MPLSPGTRLGSYEILAPLGSGGMGEVYRATDTKLGRDVALKVLPAEMGHDPERLARFRREAKALAQLDHPNIVTIYSVEECDGVNFLTMQLVAGTPLDRLIPAGGLPLNQIVEIASALGAALEAAHEKGIVHRDLKPANVMLSQEGLVKVLDFGLAKDIRGADPGNATLTSSSQTQMGVVMGTPAYMSPEQTAGRPLDHRTDIFSLGVVLHELATGRRPFEENSPAELISAILRDNPPSVTDIRPDLPSDLARIVRRCLEKDPRHRVQTARDVSNEFRDLSQQAFKHTATAAPRASRASAATDSGTARADEGFWVAVLPFRCGGGNADLAALAQGLTDEIVTGMLRFSYLRVIARGSTSKFSSEGDVRTIAKELGARYVMEGNLRQSGAKLRLAVQLVDAVSGNHIWAETYERPFSPENIFALQDDLVPRIVSTVADYYGILPHTISNTLRAKADDQLSPYEAVLRAFSYFERIAPEEHVLVKQILERAARSAPNQCEIWAMLSTIYWHEHAFGFNPQPDPLGRALTAARRSVEVASTNNLGHSALAATLFFQKNIPAFRPAAERAIELNPMDGSNLATMGMLMAYSGDWEHGCALVESALQLNPHHPGWYWFAQFLNAYRKRDYRSALDIAHKFNMPSYYLAHGLTAAAYGQLGLSDQAKKASQELLAIRPDFARAARQEFEKFYEPELVGQLIEGLRKAGLEIADDVPLAATSSAAAPVRSPSGEARAEEGFWVAVLPFKSSGSNSDIAALADGLTEDIITALSRFSYLRVIARGSTAKYSSEAADIRAIGKELGARFVMEGSLRHAGTKLRLAVQLLDATTGTHLWAENFERTFDPQTVFAVQDELVPRIVSTVADAHGILPHTMAEGIRSKNPEELTPYEAVWRSFSYAERISPEEHAVARDALERAVQLAPNYAYAWAMLSLLNSAEYEMGFNPKPEPLVRALHAARRAVELDSAGHRGYQALALVLFLRKEIEAFRAAAEKAIALNPMDGCNVAQLGGYIAYAGEWERGCALVEQAVRLNPNHPGWFWFPLFFNAYRQRDYSGALKFALKINLPGFYATPMVLAAAYGQLGQRDEARKAAQELLKLRPNMATIARPARCDMARNSPST